MQELFLLVLLTVGGCVYADGINGMYCNNAALGFPATATQVDNSISMEWAPSQSPANGVNPDYFSVLWLGTLTPPVAGTYHFGANFTTGIKVWVAEHLCIATWTPNGEITDSWIDIPLTTDPIKLRVEFFSYKSPLPSYVHLMWTIPGTSGLQVIPASAYTADLPNAGMEEAQFQYSAFKGWNTWHHANMLEQVLMPQSLGLVFGYGDTSNGQYISTAKVDCTNVVKPGLHAADGSYTEIAAFSVLTGNVHIESATTQDGNLVVLITPNTQSDTLLVVLTGEMLWGRAGAINYTTSGNGPLLSATLYSFDNVDVYATELPVAQQSFLPNPSIAFNIPASGIGFSTGSQMGISDIQTVIKLGRGNELGVINNYGSNAPLYTAMRTGITWNTIYSDLEGVLSPVTRNWDFGNDYVIFDWDNYFGALQSTLIDKTISYANLLRVTRTAEMSGGFIPNFSTGGHVSRDRSEPPVGSMVALQVYNQFQEQWILQAIYPQLLQWNKWWWNRRNVNGLFVLGSDPAPFNDPNSENQLQFAKLESGMDNSPMYDSASFDSINTHQMNVWDIGISALLVRDCADLATIARMLGNNDDAADLDNRRVALINTINSTLWDGQNNIFGNKFSDTQQFVNRYSPTSFFPLLSGMATDQQALEMINGYLTNPNEFCVNSTCQYGMPSVPKSDPAFNDNNYWRGRIWAPLNLLVYMGLQNYDHISEAHNARITLLTQASNVILQEWNNYGHVQENNNANTGQGCDVGNADAFYHWGGLNAYINLKEYNSASNPPSKHSHPIKVNLN